MLITIKQVFLFSMFVCVVSGKGLRIDVRKLQIEMKQLKLDNLKLNQHIIEIQDMQNHSMCRCDDASLIAQSNHHNTPIAGAEVSIEFQKIQERIKALLNGFVDIKQSMQEQVDTVSNQMNGLLDTQKKINTKLSTIEGRQHDFEREITENISKSDTIAKGKQAPTTTTTTEPTTSDTIYENDSPCADGYNVCRDGFSCYYSDFKCDMEMDCVDGYDEDDCNTAVVKADVMAASGGAYIVAGDQAIFTCTVTDEPAFYSRVTGLITRGTETLGEFESDATSATLTVDVTSDWHEAVLSCKAFVTPRWNVKEDTKQIYVHPPEPTCGPNDFTCNDGTCIPMTSVDDGFQDCAHYEDEKIPIFLWRRG